MSRQTGQSGRIERLSSGPATVALWLIVVLLAVHAGMVLVQPAGQSAVAQPAAPGAGAARGDNSGVYLVPGQIEKDLWGAYLVDTRAGTVVLYQYNPNSGKLKLAAARTFVYDRYLEDYNTIPPTKDIRDLITNAKRRPVEGSGEKPDEPTSP